MTTYKITNAEKYGAIDQSIYRKGDKAITVNEVWKWMEFYCESDTFPVLTANEKGIVYPYNNDYDIEFGGSWDGYYDFEFSDNCTEEDKELAETIHDQSIDVLTDNGWILDDLSEECFLVGGATIEEDKEE